MVKATGFGFQCCLSVMGEVVEKHHNSMIGYGTAEQGIEGSTKNNEISRSRHFYMLLNYDLGLPQHVHLSGETLLWIQRISRKWTLSKNRCWTAMFKNSLQINWRKCIFSSLTKRKHHLPLQEQQEISCVPAFHRISSNLQDQFHRVVSIGRVSSTKPFLLKQRSH